MYNILIAHDADAAAQINHSLQPLADRIAVCETVSDIDALAAALRRGGWHLLLCAYRTPAFAPALVIDIATALAPQTPVLFTAQAAGVTDAVAAMRMGAHGFVNYDDAAQLCALVNEELTNARRPMPTDDALRTLLDTMQDAVLSLSLPDRRLLYVSASFERIVGYPIEAFLADPDFFKQVVHPDDLARVIAARNTVLVNGFGEIDHRVVWPDGQVRWLHRRTWVNFDAAGRPIRVNDSMRDITARKETEARLLETQAVLRASEEKYRSVVESSDASITLVTPDGRYLFANRAAAKNFGMTPEEVVGKSVYDIFPPVHADALLFDVQRVIKHNEGVTIEPELRIGAQSIWFRTSVQPVRDADGQPYAAVIHASVITNKKRAEQMLQAQNAIIHQSRDLIALFDLDERLLFMNQGGLTMIGAPTFDAVLDAPLAAFHPPEDAERVRNEYIPHARRTGFWRGENRLKTLDGRLLDVEQTIFTIRDQNGAIINLAAIMTDITARKQAETALRQSETRLRSLLDSDTALNIRVNQQGICTYANRRYRKLFAWLVPDLVGAPALITVHPDDHDSVRRAVAACIAQVGTPVQVEMRKPAQDGGYLWTRWEFLAIPDHAGVVQEIQCVGFDISQQKAAEQALIEANSALEERIRQRTAELEEERNLLRTLIDAVPDFIYVKDCDSRILLSNRPHLRSFGLDDPAAIVGKNDLALFPLDMATQFIADDRTVIESGAALINREERSIGEDGREIWALTTKVPLRNLQNEIVGVVGITRNITDWRTAEAALHASEERYRTTVNALSEGVVMQGADGAIQVCNTAAEAILGVPWAQMRGMTSIDPHWRAIHADGSPFPGEEHPAMVTLRTGEPQHNVIMGVHKPNGELTWISINTAPVMLPGQSQPAAVVASFQDITVQKQAEEAMQQALREEKELGELKSRFISMASHEYRTPLATILAATESLLSYRERMTPAQIDARLEKIRQQVTHMKGLLEDVLQLARLQAGRPRFTPTRGDLHALCREIIEEFEIDPRHTGRIRFRSPHQALIADFDPRLMRQAIANLLSNALKYSAATTPVWVELQQTEEWVLVEISDSGIGIPPQDLSRLFKPFHRGVNVQDIPGTGLGLAIAKQAVDLHKGVITVENAPEQGATVQIMLPSPDARPDNAGRHDAKTEGVAL